MTTFGIQGERNYPPDDISPKKKGKDWCLKAAKAIHGDYYNSALYKYQQKIPELRRYAKGKQNTDKYLKLMGIKKDASFVNLNQEALKIGAKYTDLAVGMLSKVQLKPSCTSVDPNSIDAKTQHEFYLKSMNFMGENTKSPILQDIMSRIPNGEYEVRRYLETDYKQAIEMDMERGIDMTLYQNNWSEIEKGMKRDLVESGVACDHTYVDNTGMVRMRKVDPQFLVVPPVQNANYKDARYIGEMQFLTVADLRMLDVNNDLSDEDWRDVIDHHTSGPKTQHANNGGLMTWKYENYDSRRVEVMNFEYMSYDQIVHEEKDTKYGTPTVNRRDINYRTPKKSKYKRKELRSRFKVWYKGIWIVGTDYILAYGKCDYQVRGNRSQGKLADAKSSYCPYVLGLSEGNNTPVSLVERMIPHIDDLQLTWLKIQNTKAKTRPKGVKFDVDQVAAVAAKLGMGENDVYTVMSYFDATGNLPYSSRANAMLAAEGYLNQQDPISELDNGLPKDYRVMVEDMFNAIRMIQEVTGINDAVDASNVDSNRPVKTSQMAAMAAGTAMWNILSAYEHIFLNTCRCVAKKLQQVVSSKGPISGYIRALGEGKLMTFKLSKEISYVEFELMVTSMPDDDERQLLNDWIMKSLAARQAQGGRGGIDIGTGMKAFRMAKYSPRDAETYLIQQITKQEQIDRQAELENIQMNAQVQQQSAAQAQQGRNQEKRMDAQTKMALAQQQGQDKMDQIRLQKGLEGINTLYANRQAAQVPA